MVLKTISTLTALSTIPTLTALSTIPTLVVLKTISTLIALIALNNVNNSSNEDTLYSYILDISRIKNEQIAYRHNRNYILLS